MEIDKVLDYRAEYSAVIKKAKISGDKLTGLCPFHDDSNASFSANLKTGLWKCFAENLGGNYLQFYAKLKLGDISKTKEAYKEICEKHGIQRDRLESYTLEEYSREKHLPIDFLRKSFHASTEQYSDGVQFVKLPYNAKAYRRRYGGKTIPMESRRKA